MGSMRLLCALATAAALVAPPGRTTTRLTNNALPSDIGLEDAFDGLFDVLENAYTSGAVVDFTSAASAAADTFAAVSYTHLTLPTITEV